jgi:CPA2 family monovalent cation:H+ antiporter-2
MHVELLVVIAAAAAGAALFERLRLPAVVGFLVTGAVVGPAGLGLVEDSDRVLTLAEFGVAFLLFEIGLELPLEELRRTWRTALLAGLLQVATTIAAVAALSTAAGLPPETAIVVGMLVAMSSTALVMRVLGQLGEVDAPHGRLALGILLFQDLCVVPFLLAVPLLSGAVPREVGPMALAVGAAVLKLALLYGVARFALPFVLARVARLRSGDLFSVFAFLVAMGSAVVAEQIGLTLAVGAFIGGLVLSASPYATQLFAEVAPLRGVLLGVFFTSVGMLLDPGRALGLWAGVSVYVGGVVVFKSLVIVGIVALVLRGSLRTAVRTGLALAQTGEFSFVLATAAFGAGLLQGDVHQIFVAGSILTLVATPFLIRGSARLAGLVTAAAPEPEGGADEEVSDHAIIVGFGLAGRTLAGTLRASHTPYRIVESNPRIVEQARNLGEPIVFGDATRPSILEHVGIRRARLVSIAINDPEAMRSTIEVARALAPQVHIVARTRYVQELDGLFEQGASQVVAEELESTIDLFSKVLRRFDVPPHSIAHFADELREEGYELMRRLAAAPIDPWLAEILEEEEEEA